MALMKSQTPSATLTRQLHRADAVHLGNGQVRQLLGRPRVRGDQLRHGQAAVAGRRRSGRNGSGSRAAAISSADELAVLVGVAAAPAAGSLADFSSIAQAAGRMGIAGDAALLLAQRITGVVQVGQPLSPCRPSRDRSGP